MPDTCFACRLAYNYLIPGRQTTVLYHGTDLDGTWCAPRRYYLAYPSTFDVEPTQGYVWPDASNVQQFQALRRVGGTCPTCGVLEGKYHHLGCETEVCPRHNSALVSCGCQIVHLSFRTVVFASTIGPGGEWNLSPYSLTIWPYLLPSSRGEYHVAGGYPFETGPPYGQPY
jgi:hypothetical protein